ncbi:MAG: pyridoxal phosphate enzyme (YggS family) [Verrucomicrobiales bacterium]|jgi:pyridoxal phosphate enzyme (YggS family)
MPDADTIFENLERVNERISAACDRAGRKREDVQLLAVSKTKPVELIQLAIDAGQTAFGENRVQEGIAKVPALSDHLDWHLIGPLQKNKIRKALPLFGTIHTIENLDNAEQVNRIAAEEGLYPRVFLQLNLADEATKHGFTRQALRRDLDALLGLDRLEISGLMIIPPFMADPEDARKSFVELREFREQLLTESGLRFDDLSMGMSHDFEVAIEEGSTVVRVGTAIFGARK